MNGDILTQLFDALPFDRASATLSELRSPWGLALTDQYLTGFHAALEGSWQLHVPPLPPITMRAGDIAFLPMGRRHDVRDRPTTGLIPVADVPSCFEPVGQNVNLLRHGGRGPTARILTVLLPLDIPTWRTPLLGALPPLIRVPGDGDRPAPALAPLLHRLTDELEIRRPGYLAASRRLIELLIIDMLRMKVDEGAIEPSLFNTLGDPGISAALAAMHKDMDRAYTVSELAALAGMSRSLFAARFAALVGVSPHQYFIRFRLQQAAQLLRSGALTVLEVATRVGYRSESSFSRVFTREMGTPPATYRKEQWEGAHAGRNGDSRHAPLESGPRAGRLPAMQSLSAGKRRQGIG